MTYLSKSPSLRLSLIGVALVLMGQACGVKSGPVGSAGIFYSPNQGETWTPKVKAGQDEEGEAITIEQVSISQVMISPLTSNVLYAVAGPAGLYRSEDKAESWQKIIAQPVSNLLLDAKDTQVAYVVSGQTLWRTKDYGKNWSVIYIEATPRAEINDITQNPVEPNKLYLATGKGLVMLLSQNQGEAWQRVKIFDKPIIKLMFYPRDPKIIYAIENGGVIWRSQDSGNSWSAITKNLQTQLKVKLRTFRDLVILPGAGEGLLYANSLGIYRSLDAGQNWSALTLLTRPGSVNITALGINPKNANNIIYCAQGVLFKSSDGGINWTTRRLPSPLAVTSLVVSPDDPNSIYISLGQ